jgi:hypothetical protein
MRVGIRIAMTTEAPRPLSFLHGLRVMLLFGMLTSALTSGFIVQLTFAVHSNRVLSFFLLPITILVVAAFTLPVIIAVGWIPISIFYCIMRWLSLWVRMTIVTRLLVGSIFGLFCNIFLIHMNSVNPTWPQRDPYYFPYIEIEAAAVTLALVSRARWFGGLSPRDNDDG